MGLDYVLAGHVVYACLNRLRQGGTYMSHLRLHLNVSTSPERPVAASKRTDDDQGCFDSGKADKVSRLTPWESPWSLTCPQSTSYTL